MITTFGQPKVEQKLPADGSSGMVPFTAQQRIELSAFQRININSLVSSPLTLPPVSS